MAMIHHFAESWKPPIERRLHNMEVVMNRKYGSKGGKIGVHYRPSILGLQKDENNGYQWYCSNNPEK